MMFTSAISWSWIRGPILVRNKCVASLSTVSFDPRPTCRTSPPTDLWPPTTNPRGVITLCEGNTEVADDGANRNRAQTSIKLAKRQWRSLYLYLYLYLCEFRTLGFRFRRKTEDWELGNGEWGLRTGDRRAPLCVGLPSLYQRSHHRYKPSTGWTDWQTDRKGHG